MNPFWYEPFRQLLPTLNFCEPGVANAAQRQGSHERYVTNLTDEESALIEPLFLVRRRLGRPRTKALREMINAILDVLSSGYP